MEIVMNPFHRVRRFHGLFVLAYLAAYFSGDEGALLHVWLGYGLVAFLVARLIVARARVKGFPALWPSFRSGMTVTAASRAVVVALLLSVGVTLAAGLAMVDNARVLGITGVSAMAPADAEAAREESGGIAREFFQEIEDVHEIAANTTLGLAGLHVALLLAFRRRFALNMIPGFEGLARRWRGLAAKASKVCGDYLRFSRLRQTRRTNTV
jgi:3-ketosteroid 9alpha-monooxygenase subunit B